MVAVFISYQHHFIRFSTCSALSLIFFKSFFISCPFMTSMEGDLLPIFTGKPDHRVGLLAHRPFFYHQHGRRENTGILFRYRIVIGHHHFIGNISPIFGRQNHQVIKNRRAVLRLCPTFINRYQRITGNTFLLQLHLCAIDKRQPSSPSEQIRKTFSYT